MAWTTMAGLTGSLLAAAAAAHAQPWQVSGELWGKPAEDGDFHGKPAADVSGLACGPATSGRRLCLLVDDESQGAQLVVLEPGRLVAGDFIPLVTDRFDGKPVELDAEAAAYADGGFYLTGSHGRARHEEDQAKQKKNDAKAQASRRLFRLRFGPDDVELATAKLKPNRHPERSESKLLPELIRRQPLLAGYYDKPLADNGLTVEGMAAAGGRLYFGFRGPIVRDHYAVVLSAPASALFDRPTGDGKAGDSEPDGSVLIQLDLSNARGSPRGIRDLAVWADGLIGIAGPVNDPEKATPIGCGDYAVFYWSDKAGLKLQELAGFPAEQKPEALTPLGEANGKLTAILSFDGPKHGASKMIELSFTADASCRTPQ